MTGRPPAEVTVTEELVRELLAAQCPQYLPLPLVRVAAGWDNEVFRLGDALAVRVPRRALAAPLLAHELRWLPLLAPLLPVPVPAPVVAGRPTERYPWPWAVVPWLPGVPAAYRLGSNGLPAAAARTLGGFLRALHRPAPPDAPANPFRGVALAERHATVVERLDGARERAAWDAWSAAQPWDGPPLWLHGDLHPLNLLLDGHAVSGVVDFGDLTAGDPAWDLGIAWLAFAPRARAALAAEVAVDAATWSRARAVALLLATVFRATATTGSPEEAIASFALRQLFAQPPVAAAPSG